ncbi:FTR1 family protein, partial [Klebsiella pneumoniae]|uniref:FTR1 family protein n=1 Tax=Klebsiella pneumoniae TaxID=573 RepID=UPI003714F9F1
MVVAVAVLREGSEVALFLYGVVVGDGSSGLSLLLGGVLGLVLGIAVCLLTYFGLVRIPARPLFRVTTLLIALLAAGMGAQAVAF